MTEALCLIIPSSIVGLRFHLPAGVLEHCSWRKDAGRQALLTAACWGAWLKGLTGLQQVTQGQRKTRVPPPCFSRTSLILSGFLPEMSNTAPPTKKIACLLLADQGQRRRRQRKCHTQRNSKISWKDIHDLVTAAWPCALHKPLSPLFL